MFADSPHLLKLIRTNVLSGGLQLPDGSVLDSSLFEEIWKLDNPSTAVTPTPSSSSAAGRTHSVANLTYSASPVSTELLAPANCISSLGSDGQLKLCPRLTRAHIDVSSIVLVCRLF